MPLSDADRIKRNTELLKDATEKLSAAQEVMLEAMNKGGRISVSLVDTLEDAKSEYNDINSLVQSQLGLQKKSTEETGKQKDLLAEINKKYNANVDSLFKNAKALGDILHRHDDINKSAKDYGRNIGGYLELMTSWKGALGLVTMAFGKLLKEEEALNAVMREWTVSIAGASRTLGGFTKNWDGIAKAVHTTWAETAKFGWSIQESGRFVGELGMGLNTNQKRLVELNKLGITFVQGFSMSAEGAGKLMRVLDQSNISRSDTLKIQHQLMKSSEEMGIPISALGKDIEESADTMALWGENGKRSMVSMISYAKQFGSSFQVINKSMEVYNKLSSGGDQAAKIGAMFNVPINAMKMLVTTRPEERLEMIRKQILGSGQDWKTMGYYQRQTLTEMTGGNATVAEAMFTQGKNMKSAAEIQRQYDNESKTKSFNDAKRQNDLNKMLDKTIQLFRDTGPALKNMYAAMNKAFAPLYDALFGGRKSIIDGLTNFFNGLSQSGAWMKGIQKLADTIKYLAEMVVKLMGKATPENLAMMAKFYGGMVLLRGGVSLAGSMGGIVSGVSGVVRNFGTGAAEGWTGKPRENADGTPLTDANGNPIKGRGWGWGDGRGNKGAGAAYGAAGGAVYGAGSVAAMLAENAISGEEKNTTGAMVGAGLGSVAGGAIGGLLGSFIPVFGTALGTAAGSYLGEWGGESLGKAIGGKSFESTDKRMLREYNESNDPKKDSLHERRMAIKLEANKFSEQRKSIDEEKKVFLDEIMMKKKQHKDYKDLSEQEKIFLRDNNIRYDKLSKESLPGFAESLSSASKRFEDIMNIEQKRDFKGEREESTIKREVDKNKTAIDAKDKEIAVLQKFQDKGYANLGINDKKSVLKTMGVGGIDKLSIKEIDDLMRKFTSQTKEKGELEHAKNLLIQQKGTLEIQNAEKQVTLDKTHMQNLERQAAFEEVRLATAEWKATNPGGKNEDLRKMLEGRKDIAGMTTKEFFADIINKFAPNSTKKSNDSGGIAMVASTVRVAQNGVPEAIVPLPKGGLSSLVPPINVTLMLDKQVLARVVAKQLVSQSLGTG